MVKAFKKSNNIKPLNLDTCGINEDNLDLFFRMIYERQMIWKRRFIDKLPKPWTSDKIFEKYKFCNVYREHDRSSQWEIRNIIMDESLSVKNLLWKILVYRAFNNPETFARGLKKWQNGIPNYEEYDKEEFAAHIAELRDLGLNPFTNAYSITGAIVIGESIDSAFCNTVVPSIHESIDAILYILDTAANPQQIATFLITLPGVSDFMAHEYYQDFTYVPIYSSRALMKWGPDDFTNLGPGSSQGVRLLFSNLKKSDQLSSYYYLQYIAEEKLEEIGLEKGELMPYASWDKDLHEYKIIQECNFSLNQIEGALCEFSKYMRILRGTGRPRCYEFEPKTSTLIVQRTNEENSQDEFITDQNELIGHKGIRKTKALDDFASSTGNKIPKRKRDSGSDLTVNLNLNLNINNLESILTKLLNL